MLIKTIPTDLGYLLIDNSNSELPPGTPKIFEVPTYTCTHCQRVVILNPERKRERYKCRGCSHLLCDDCGAARAAGNPCKTFNQLIDEHLTQVTKQS